MFRAGARLFSSAARQKPIGSQKILADESTTQQASEEIVAALKYFKVVSGRLDRRMRDAEMGFEVKIGIDHLEKALSALQNTQSFRPK